jgi:sortase (surface protein transpeptidase)
MPGAPSGTAVLAGHVDSRVSGLGTFSVLRDLQPGDPVRVRGEDGRTFFFRVVARREVTKGALPDEVFSRHGPARLALVTCGGRFVPRLHGYEDNVIVFAEPDRARPPR